MLLAQCFSSKAAWDKGGIPPACDSRYIKYRAMPSINMRIAWSWSLKSDTVKLLLHSRWPIASRSGTTRDRHLWNNLACSLWPNLGRWQHLRRYLHVRRSRAGDVPTEASVGECLVGRHASGVAVERCVVFGVGRIGSVGLAPGRASVLSVSGSVIIALHVVSCCLCPHTMIPLPWPERPVCALFFIR
eukprot:scaffold14998_cov121-Isochrysis_galbana.AAC.2